MKQKQSFPKQHAASFLQLNELMDSFHVQAIKFLFVYLPLMCTPCTLRTLRTPCNSEVLKGRTGAHVRPWAAQARKSQSSHAHQPPNTHSRCPRARARACTLERDAVRTHSSAHAATAKCQDDSEKEPQLPVCLDTNVSERAAVAWKLPSERWSRSGNAVATLLTSTPTWERRAAAHAEAAALPDCWS